MSESIVENKSPGGVISPEFEQTLHKGFIAARDRRHKYITVEHLLLALLDDADALQVLDACNADIGTLRKQLAVFVEENTPLEDGAGEVDVQPSLGFQRVVQRSIMHVQAGINQQRGVTGANALVSIFGENDSHAVYYLNQQGINRLNVVNFVTAGIRKPVENVGFEEQLENLTSEALRPGDSEPSTPSSDLSAHDSRLRVFISYSHLDAICLERLLIHLRPLNRGKLIDSWSDTRIRSGDKWRSELQDNLKTAAVAVLLISADFLASDFIVNDELPPLLVKAESDGLRLIPVVLKPCGYLRDRTLQKYQSINDPLKPLLGMSMIEQEFVYDKIAAEIEEEIKMRLGK
ncbi:Clp protease N-terminal domain-containing protein [Polaromonas sp.]|uniref:Clp protease N-terminal domain-containing protein n=1 Tax=Polaromonas sp. TaxID=1869339 RepID=UPI00351F464D